MLQLEACHARGFVARALGGCNAAKTALNKCLRDARAARTAENRAQARRARARPGGRWAAFVDNAL